MTGKFNSQTKGIMKELIVPILMYHDLTKEKVKNAYMIKEGDFQDHMEFIKSHHYHTILIDEYYQFLTNPSVQLPEKCVIITFDDGHESDCEIALPILKKLDLKATFFITTDWIGLPGYMTGLQINKLKDAGMSVQSHGASHFLLDKLGYGDIQNDLKRSIKSLEDLIGKAVAYISFPGGRYNNEVIECAKQLKVSAVLSSEPFSIKKYGNLYLIGRFVMKYSFRKLDIRKIICSGPTRRFVFRASYFGKSLLKKLLPNNLYSILWKKYISRTQFLAERP